MHERESMNMKKIISFIKTIILLIMIGILGYIGTIVYNEITNTSIVDDVQEFVSNITVSSGGIDESLKTPQILETTAETISPYDEKIDYSNSTVDKYLYNQLNEYSKIIYNAMESNKENMKTGTYEINLGAEFSSLLSESNGEELLGEYYQSAIEAYTYDNPDVFYIEFSKLYLNIETTVRGNKKTYKVFLNAGNNTDYLTSEFLSKERIDAALNEIGNIKSYFVNNKKTDTYENIKIAHDYLVESIEYDQTISLPNIYNLYGALINKKSVCEGYAKAFKYLMDSMNIPCIIVSGVATNSEGNTESHAWNYVQLNGIWYAVDCTWDDPILIGPGYLSNFSKYKYFLKGEDEFNKTHIPKGQFTEGGKVFKYPSLSQTNY